MEQKHLMKHVKGTRMNVNEMCNSLLDSETCNMSNSCVWTHSKEDEDGNMEEKCVAGNDLGATFNADKYVKTFFNGLEI